MSVWNILTIQELGTKSNNCRSVIVPSSRVLQVALVSSITATPISTLQQWQKTLPRESGLCSKGQLVAFYCSFICELQQIFQLELPGADFFRRPNRKNVGL